jgi:hypothetical protein
MTDATGTRNRLTAMTNGVMATFGFAPNNAVISTGQRATFGYAYTLDGVGNRTKTELNEPREGNGEGNGVRP